MTQRVDELLAAAVALPPAEREDFLDSACDGDEALRVEVASLLELVPDAEGFLESPPQLEPTADETGEPNPEERIGQRVGAYRLVRPIGEGGMGTVYLAERDDGVFEKRVAVKLIRSEHSTDLARRFLTERQALAGLEHPNIARLLDGGATSDGVPFLVMEYVEGGEPIDRACHRLRLPEHRRIELLIDVCNAVQHAHGKLIVHRDIKPSNVLLDADRQVKLLDFGIAKILGPVSGSTGRSADELRTARGAGRTALPQETAAGSRVLTPAYASPEQLRGEPVTTASDVYSLGVLASAVLLGSLPDADGNELPTGDLGHVLRKALEQDPTARYATPEQLGADLRRFLRDRPVSAVRDGWRYRTRMFYRRHRIATVSAALVALAMVAATAISVVSSFRAEAARRVAEDERRTAQQVSGFLEEVLGSIDPNVAQGRDTAVLEEVIDGAAARIPVELADQPLVAARLHSTLGRAYERIARYEDAERQLRRAIEIWRSTGDSSLADTLVQLSNLLHQLARHDESERIAREAIDVARREPSDPTAEAAALTALGTVLFFKAETAEAERALREAVAIQRRDPLVDDAGLAHSVGVLGWLLATSDRAEEAVPLLRESLAIYRRRSEEVPLSVSVAVGRLAYALRALARYEEALELYEEDVALSRRLLGELHPNHGTALSQLASLHEFRGDLDRAEPIYLQALEVQRAALGPEHREVGTTLNNLGGLYRKMGRYEEAARHLREALQVYTKVFGDDHAWTTIARGNLVKTHVDRGDYQAAEEEAVRYLERARRHWPESHWRVATFESVLGACRLERGDRKEAERLLRESYRKLEAGLGADDERTRTARDRLARFDRETGREGL